MFKRKKWRYLILDEAHMIKNWKSQRWQALLVQPGDEDHTAGDHAHLAELGGVDKPLAVAGDSAGGNATVVVGQLLASNPAAVPVVLQVPIFPLVADANGSASMAAFSDGFLLTGDTMAFFDAAYGADRADPRGFPILSDHSGAPPTIVVTASLDPIRDSGRAYAKALVDAGRDCVFIEMRGVTHSFTNLRQMVPSTQRDLERVIAAMQFMLGNPA